jgi:hypothetical protein
MRASGDGSLARMHGAGAAAALGSALALGACFQLKADVPPDGGADSGVDTGTADAGDVPDAGDAGDTGEACSPPIGGCDFWVGSSPDAGGCTYTTITAAVAAAQSSSCATSPKVHVAAGSYSAGETFPIVARAVSIEGAGPDTIVSGAGPVGLLTTVTPPKSGTNALSMADHVAATFLVGDGAGQTSISKLSIVASPLAGYTIEGIVCDRGNASAAPPPNTTIDRVTAQGFDAAVRVTWSQLPAGAHSGCNARIVNSVLKDGWFGVIADGYGTNMFPVQRVSLRLGDSATDGNQLVNFHFSGFGAVLNGAGLVIDDAVTGAVIRGNTFTNADFGFWILQQDYDPIGFDIEDNTVGPVVYNEGIGLFGNVRVSSFVNNLVQGVSMHPVYSQTLNWLAVGLSLGRQGLPGIPYIKLARNNTFVGNDVAVDIRSTTDPLPTDVSKQSDFGTAASPGGNVFRCNSGWEGTTGGDVFVEMSAPEPPSVPVPVVPFEGNSWDHVPPTTIVTDGGVLTVPRGLDVYVYGTRSGADGGWQPVGGAIDTADASIASIECPDGNVPCP